MSFFVNGLDVNALLVKLDLRIITLELTINELFAQLPNGAITDETLNNIRSDAKQRLHNKYPQLEIKD